MPAVTAAQILPDDPQALLIGRVWSDAQGGPCPVLYRQGQLLDLSRLSPTTSGLLERETLVADLTGDFPALGPLDGFLNQGDGTGTLGRLLAPLRRRARSVSKSSAESGTPAGMPSIEMPICWPCDSPQMASLKL